MLNKSKVQIQIVTWNSEKDIGRCLRSISEQAFPIHRVLVIDNGSQDRTLRICKNRSEVVVVPLGSNTGFAHAHNVGIRYGQDCEYILILNPDVVLSHSLVESCIKTINQHPKTATVSPVCIRGELTNESKIITIDAAGIVHSPAFRFKNDLEGEKVKRTALQDRRVFANTGACIFVSTRALQVIAQKNVNGQLEYFDEFFFAYKEDIDLCWRLSRKEFVHYVNTDLAAHARTLQSSLPLKNRQKKLQLYSYRNHILCLWKNLTIKQVLSLGFCIALYELVKGAYYLLTKPQIFVRAWKDIFFYITSHKRLA